MTIHESHEIVVIGAGVSGLALAHDLHRSGQDVLVLERAAEPGGCARTEQRDGFLFEQGPFNLLVRNPLFESLLEDLSGSLEVVPPGPQAKVREILLGGVRRKVPMSLGEAVSTPLLSFPQKLRAIAEPLLGRRPASTDPTLGDLVRRRFGDGVADHLVSAIVAGVYGGDSDRLSARSCFPLLWEIDQKSSSLVFGLIRRGFQSKGKHKRRWKGMVSFRGGVGSFTRAMASSLGGRLRLQTEVCSIQREAEGYLIETGEQSYLAKRLVLAVDLPVVRKLLRPWAEPVARKLDPIQSVSLAVVNAGFGAGAFPSPPQGFGFLVPKTETDVHILGALWASSVFPHQAPEGCHSIRIFVGGTRSPEWTELPEAELVKRSLDELGRFIEIAAPPRALCVSRWQEAVPQMVPGHADRIAEVDRLLEGYPGLYLVGNYLAGVSVNDCVVHARTVAERMLKGT